jgi:hypothetical protein
MADGATPDREVLLETGTPGSQTAAVGLVDGSGVGEIVRVETPSATILAYRLTSSPDVSRSTAANSSSLTLPRTGDHSRTRRARIFAHHGAPEAPRC